MQDVLWVPSDPSQFITWGSDLRHYSVTRDQEVSYSQPIRSQLCVSNSQSEASFVSVTANQSSPFQLDRSRVEHVIPLSCDQVALHLGTLQEPQYVR